MNKRKPKKTRYEVLKSVAAKAARRIELEIKALLDINDGPMPADRPDEWKKAIALDVERGEQVSSSSGGPKPSRS